MFYSNGKFLISGEYLVLKGATALAVPLKFGQDLIIEEKEVKDKPLIYWKAYENEKLWFDLSLSPEGLTPIETSDQLKAEKLLQILKSAYKLNPNFIDTNKSYLVSTRMDFNKNWGMGSSSSLVNNIAQWTKTDPYHLLNESFGGSGYDIACASAKKSILYKLENDKPNVKQLEFYPDFHKNIYFIYLGKKQDSSKSITEFNAKRFNNPRLTDKISEITIELTKISSIEEFQSLIKSHEEIISRILKRNRVKEEYFSDFDGEIKSLGGWGGDFIMAISNMDEIKTKNYFQHKSLETIFNYQDIVKHESK